MALKTKSKEAGKRKRSSSLFANVGRRVSTGVIIGFTIAYVVLVMSAYGYHIYEWYFTK